MWTSWRDLGFGDNLLDEFRRWEQEMDNLFSATGWPAGIRWSGQGAFPPVNIGSGPDSVEVYLFGGGLDPKSIDVSLQQNLLTVAGQREAEPEESGTFYRRERFAGQFQRVVTLPEDVDPEHVQASYRNGILHISVKRREAAKPRQIEVQ